MILRTHDRRDIDPGAAVIPDVKKIAVVRANGIGDFVFSLPAFQALRDTYPHAEITLFGKQWHKDFLESRKGPVDRVIVLPRCRLIDDSISLEESTAALKLFFREHVTNDTGYDIAIQMHGGGGNSNPFTRRLRARVSVGFASDGAPLLDRTIRYQQYANETLRCLELVRTIGASTSYLHPSLPITRQDLDESRSYIPAETPFVLLHPSATDPRRLWPAERFAEIADELHRRGFAIALNGTEQERPVTRAVKSAMQAPAFDLTGISLGGLYGAISRASLVVSNDSGPLHLAVPAGTPSVGIVWCGNAITASPVDIDRHAFAVSWRTTCPVCHRNTRQQCDHYSTSWVTDVPVDEVLTLISSLLNSTTPRKRDYIESAANLTRVPSNSTRAEAEGTIFAQ